MDFSFTKEQDMLRKAIREFGETEITPHVKRMDEEQKVPSEIFEKLGRMGVWGANYPPEHGGSGLDPVSMGVIVEELARADIGCAIPTLFLVGASWGHVLDKYGTAEAKKAIFPRVTRGHAFLGIASTEADMGSDVGAMATVARRDGDDYVLTGEKMFISGVKEVMEQLPLGGGYVTLAKTDPSKGTKGISLFFVPFEDKERISPTYFEDWGRRGVSTGGFTMNGLRIPSDYLIGKENMGFYYAMEGFDYARALISLVCASAGMTALERAMEYAKMRTAFGLPIAKYEGVQFKLAENWVKLNALRMMGYRALWFLGKEMMDRSAGRFQVTMACAEAKLLGPVTAFEAINDAIQWFGAYGYTVECELALALKAVRSYFWAEGAVEIQKIIVARELLGRDFIAYKGRGQRAQSRPPQPSEVRAPPAKVTSAKEGGGQMVP